MPSLDAHAPASWWQAGHSAVQERLPGWAMRVVEWLPRAVAAVLAGLLMYLSFPPHGWWWTAPTGFAVLVWILRAGRSLRGGFGYGLLAGLALFVPLLPWVGIYVGAGPWLALAFACSLYVGIFGVLARAVVGLRAGYLWVACAWVLTEWARSSFPFGGFPWGRLGFGQANGLFLPLASLAGVPAVSFAVAIVGAGLAYALTAGSRRPRTLASLAGPVSAAAVTAVLAAAMWPLLPGPDDGSRTITVAAIQGSVPRLGLDFNTQRRAVLDNHVRETMQLAQQIHAGQTPQPDLVVWPENASDVDPLRDADAASEIDAAVRAVGAPILVGAVLVNDNGTTTNSVIVWNPGTGPGDRHDKKIIQPFGEYMPMRSFFRHFSAQVDRAGNFVPGTGDGTVNVAGTRVGVATCYEVAFDRAFEQAVTAGAQLLTVPTNNATFGRSDMTYQQLAMSRVRAVEHGRAVIVAATTGVSAIIAANGQIMAQSPQIVPAILIHQVPLRHTETLATRVAWVPEAIACIAALLAVGIGLRRRRSEGRPDSTDGTDVAIAAHPATVQHQERTLTPSDDPPALAGPGGTA